MTSTYCGFDHNSDDTIYCAGEKAPAGRYVEIETRREILMDIEDFLPASLDGRVAVYRPKPLSWAELRQS